MKERDKWYFSQRKEEPILDEDEKAYLEGVIRPFKDCVLSIRKIFVYYCGHKTYDYVEITHHNYETLNLPYFNAGAMYKGMKYENNYSLEELGLFEE